jgi:sugar/nucleoside kinase (ribokinase family)
MSDMGIATILLPAKETTYMKVVHPTGNVDDREMTQVKNAGFFTIPEIPEFRSRYVHLAGITDQEFTPEFVQDMKNAGYDLSVDMQSFVRQVDPETRKISLADVPIKKDIVQYFSRIKLDGVEAEIVTGKGNIDAAAQILESWGSRETIITQSSGVLARVAGISKFEKFTNRTFAGRTGRGDTTFAGYLAWRMNHDVSESLQFAAALASLKMEKAGPFDGTLDDVLARMTHASVRRT